MSETKWTAGPWRREVSDDGFLIVGPRKGCIRNGKRNQWVLAEVGNPEFWSERKFRAEDLANARLIRAAPDLYAALDRLRGVIESAGVPNLADGVQLGRTSWLHKAGDALDAARAALARARGEPA